MFSFRTTEVMHNIKGHVHDGENRHEINSSM